MKRKQKHNVHYFVDMDGTLARFFENENCLTEMYNKGYFENLRPYEKLVADIRTLAKSGKQIYILSVCVQTPYCSAEKKAWINKYLPEIPDEHIILLRNGASKSQAVIDRKLLTKTNILLDDYSANLEDWTANIKGGVAIKVLNEINGHNHNYGQVIVNI